MINNLNHIYTITKSIDINLLDIKNVLIIIPCFNESLNIDETIKNLYISGNYNFIIIDDCSSDDIVDKCKKNNWNFISNEINFGLSKSFRVGVDYAIKNNYKYVVQYDGDGQHNASDIKKLLFLANKGYDIVSTTRYYNDSNTLDNKKILAHKLLRTLFYIKTRERISDPTCGMRLYNWNAMEIYNNNKKLEVECSSIAYMVKYKKMKLIENPTNVYSRKNGKSLFKNKSVIIKYMIRQVGKLLFLFTLGFGEQYD